MQKGLDQAPNIPSFQMGGSLLPLSATQGRLPSRRLLPLPLLHHQEHPHPLPGPALPDAVSTCGGEGGCWRSASAITAGHGDRDGWDIAHYPANDAEPTPALFAPRSGLSAVEQQSHRGNRALGRFLFSAVMTYTHLKIHPPSRKANPERRFPCQGLQRWSWATCR